MAVQWQQRNAPQAMAEINVTSLIDVMLALVLVLMVTAPVALHRIPLPLASGDGVAEPRTLRLSIQSTGELFLQGVAVSRAGLATQLATAAAETVPPVLEVHPEASARYDDVAYVLALAKRSGTTAIRVAGAAQD